MKGNKFVRFQDWKSENSYGSEHQYSTDDGFYSRRIRPIFAAIWGSINLGFENGSKRLKNLGKNVNFKSKIGEQDKGETVSKYQIIDPQGQFLQKWNKIFVLACVIAVSVDPLFFYIPVIDDKRSCLDLDKKMETTACVLRTLIDMFYVVHMMFQFRTGYIKPYTRVFGRGELVDDPFLVAKRYLTTDFLIDVLSILPLPQIVVLIIIPSLDGQVSLVGKDILKFVIWLQYIPRIGRIYPLFKQVTTSSGILTETAWAGAVYNLFLYMLASHILGAFWYLFSIERQDTCWRKACDNITGCDTDGLYCNHLGNFTEQSSRLRAACPFIPPDDIKNSSVFNFGIFIDALDSEIVQSWDFPKKFFFCFWWGLRNLSSLGQNLKTSTNVWEIIFAVVIAIAGLVLFALLIGNMQKYLESTTVRIEEMRVKRQDAEQWMSHRMLPEHLRKRIRSYEQYKWQETRGVDEQTLIHTLPKDLRREINHHLCYDLIKRVPMFAKMDGQILDAICDRLRPALYIKDSFIAREGEPVEEMVFIMRGDLVSATTNGGRTGFFNEVYLKSGDFCGEGLLTWALDPQSTSNLPISTRTVQALSEVEAFALVADDLKSVATQFRRLHHKDIQHAFKLFSVQWRTWAACFIQSAWRRYCRRKQAKILYESEDRLVNVLENEATSASSIGATIFASKFAANALRNLRQNGGRAPTRLPQPQRLALVPQKPPEPDFSSHHH